MFQIDLDPLMFLRSSSSKHPLINITKIVKVVGRCYITVDSVRFG